MAVYKDTNGSYFVSISYRDLNGNVRTKRKRGFRTKRDALNFEPTLHSLINQDNDMHLTYEELFNIFIEKNSVIANKVTIDEKKYIARNFWPDLFPKKVSSIKTKDYLKVWTSIANTNYSRGYKNKVILILKAISKFGYRYYNYPDNAKSLENIQKTASDVTNFDVWTPSEFNQFISVIKSPILVAYYAFLFRTGARRSEALGLLKSDIQGNIAIINKAMKHFSVGHLPLKNAASHRTITLDKKTLSLLMPLIKKDGSYLFGHHTTIALSTIQREFKKGIEDSGVKEIRVHDLRHSHATYLISKNINIVAVSKRLGHEDINTTLKIYTHLLKESEDQLINVLNDTT